MRLHFVAADLEENLGVGILAAIAERHGHEAIVVPFNDVSETDSAVAQVLAGAPDVIGLSAAPRRGRRARHLLLPR